MDINNAIEKIGFGEPFDEKPALRDIQDFFDSRLKPTDGEAGIVVSSDPLGNTVYTSLNKGEETFAGQVSASLIATKEGISLVSHNRGLLKRIYKGGIKPIGESLGGFESNVYRISLATSEGPRDFALKYTFPVLSEDNYSRYYSHTSGIVAMRIMQMAKREQPVPYVTYIAPILATHDITLAPFIDDGIHTQEFFDYLFYPIDGLDAKEFEEKYNLTPEKIHLLHEIWRYEENAGSNHSFYKEFRKVLRKEDEGLVKWVDDKVRGIEEFSSFQYRSDDTFLSQSVVSLDSLFQIFSRFKSDTNLNADNPEFSQGILQSLSLVELGVSTVEITK